MKKRTEIIIGAVILVVVVAAAILIKNLVSVERYQNEVANMTYTDIDITSIPDGTYTGESDVQYIYAKVEVTVQQGKISNIKLLEHRHERGIAAEGIEDQIVAQQRVDVDAVSGATNSSQVIKKAVDNALVSASGSDK